MVPLASFMSCTASVGSSAPHAESPTSADSVKSGRSHVKELAVDTHLQVSVYQMQLLPHLQIGPVRDAVLSVFSIITCKGARVNVQLLE
jgi:hypothetical protein